MTALPTEPQPLLKSLVLFKDSSFSAVVEHTWSLVHIPLDAGLFTLSTEEISVAGPYEKIGGC